MLSYQDFEKAENRPAYIAEIITRHRDSPDCQTAVTADLYDRQKNVTINQYVRMIRDRTNNPIVDITAANNRIASNFFHRLNVQRCAYLLGNGVSFTRKEERANADGIVYQADVTKEKLGNKFDTDLNTWAYKALIHGVAFGFWNVDRLYVFPLTEFAPLWDETTGALRAGVRFWRLAADKPITAVLYTETGYTTYKSRPGTTGLDLVAEGDEQPYILRVQTSEARGEIVTGYEDYGGALPIIPMWGSSLKQSTLVGMREKIDSYDLIQSGFANDLTDCAQIYWLIQNCGGMTDEDLQKFLDDLRFRHVAKVDTQSFDGDSRSALSPYVQDVPYQGRQAYLDGMRKSIYEDFGALDVHAIAARSTNDHIDAAYQPMDEEADLFEFQVIEAVQKLLALMGIEDTPIFKRNRISNVKEAMEALAIGAQWLDLETIISKMSIISEDERPGVLARKMAEDGRGLDAVGV